MRFLQDKVREHDNHHAEIQQLAPADMTIVSWMLRTSWRARWLVISLGVFGAAIGVAVVVVSKRVYRAEALVMPVSIHQRGPLDAISGNLGDLAALAGINTQVDSSARLALATLKGKMFTATFIRDKGLMPALFPDRWDGRMSRWKGPPPQRSKPWICLIAVGFARLSKIARRDS